MAATSWIGVANDEVEQAVADQIVSCATDGLEGIVNSVDIPTRATGSKATKTAEAFVRSLIQSSNPDAYMSLAQAIADAPVPEYNKIKVPLLCVAGQEDQVAQLEDLALIGDEYVMSLHPHTPFPTVALIPFPHMPALEHAMHACHAVSHAHATYSRQAAC